MKRKHIKQICAALICLLLVIAALTALKLFAGRFEEQKAAERWQTQEKPFSQVSCFITDKENCSYNDVMNMADDIDEALASDAVEEKWLYAYSTEASVSVKTESEVVTARAVCTGGNFFQIHPLDMISGWYYEDRDINGISVVLDKRLAWSLFGGYDLTGMELEINGYRCVIAGVCRPPEKEPGKTAYGEEPTIYLPYSLLSEIDIDKAVNCFEAVLPNPIKGYALGKLEKNMEFTEGNFELLENTGRFGLLNTLKNVYKFGRKIQNTAGVSYPYWEFEARNAESRCQLIAVAAVLFALYPLYVIIFYLIKLIKIMKNRRTKKCIKS
jgi:hypothetical protein